MRTLVVCGAGAKRVANRFVNCAALARPFRRWRGWVRLRSVGSGDFSTFVSRDSRTMLTDQAVLDRFVDDYPTELLPTDAQRGWLMRVKAAHHGSKPCATACETVNWESS